MKTPGDPSAESLVLVTLLHLLVTPVSATQLHLLSNGLNHRTLQQSFLKQAAC